MIALAAITGAALALAIVLAFEITRVRADLAAERRRVDSLLDRVQSRSLAEYVAVAPSAAQIVPPPPSYLSDSTGLISFEDTDG